TTALRPEFYMVNFCSERAALLTPPVVTFIYLLLDFVTKSVALPSCGLASLVSHFRNRSYFFHPSTSGNLFSSLHFSKYFSRCSCSFKLSEVIFTSISNILFVSNS